ncbi:hypothetical protein Lepto7375DRAFT_8144 [Leptolyngbya sp. PCC 7375]|nr:hypothetical protein Lepto7375DRAFT_8144 [Leptolyngbya sp. PCC 7375]
MLPSQVQDISNSCLAPLCDLCVHPSLPTVYTHLEDNVPKSIPGLELLHSARSRFGVYILNLSPWGRRTLRPGPPSPSGSKGLGDVELALLAEWARDLEQLSDLCIHSSPSLQRGATGVGWLIVLLQATA